MHKLFMTKENRDAAFEVLKAEGKKCKRSSSGLTLIHPQYVEDFPDQSIKADNGFGNAHYKTRFEKLYSLEVLA